MCYYVDQKSTKSEVKAMFNISVDNADRFYQGTFINGFEHPNLPIITNEQPEVITTDATWGLVPSWAKDTSFRDKTLNARIEGIDTTPSYRNINSNRCVIVATSYYEWRWLDPKGKTKVRYQIFSQTDEIFVFAGLFDTWTNPENGEVLKSFTMVTTEANELMKYVHNNRERMPVMLKRQDVESWLDAKVNIKKFAYPYDPSIVAFEVA
ncbi:SOS response-associated peptidase [Flavobacterium sp. 3-210]